MPRDILDSPIPSEGPKIRQPFVWVLDFFMLGYALLLFVGTFISFIYGTSGQLDTLLSTVLLAVVIGVFLIFLGAGLFLFLYKWYRVSSKHDKSWDKQLLVQFQSETKSALIPSSKPSKTAAELVRESSMMIALFSVIALIILFQRDSISSSWLLLVFGFMGYAVLSVGYCLLINRLIRKFLAKH